MCLLGVTRSRERENRLKFWGKITWNLSERTLEWSAPQITKRGFISQKVRFEGGSQEDILRFEKLWRQFLDEKCQMALKG
jgi:hypothetical protein